jgi:hypothetical protein
MAKGDVKILGLDKVIKNLNSEIHKIEGRTMKGLILATILVQREVEPKVPVDTGNLRASWFTTPVESNKNPVVFLGFSANYALWVHEMVGATFQRPTAQAKFLESTLKQNQKKILEIIAKTAHV